ncbi:uracil-DNA glycosylase [Verminephrobacter aporrectodeae subsp. tuberculatae]|uniref:uracil-DNA glycosylase n=1 Tax=Verminephrobacter aporrectodeae TaxID=1110389 RepID=UPI0022386772|nr:uracil-DNA glycosylase [Verminephrobacter aporrectodeae]MCW5255693.1 uracil-DNA glycosylase [Verminephrobacter aporrectodeae subsp. tuberculatae]MCW8166538.1 uracil-DNA glycosylase [Verminephrobacter aporrectodeae subsp. tuberculatae]MCW8170618.1 uracil-DNA glycosylase [Verminephrobacter aporrectodeae subsp. tuberculatae]
MNDMVPPPPTRLMRADPADWPVAPGWQPLVDAFFAGARGQALLAFLQARLQAGTVIFPPRPLRALELTPPERVRVVILGQDPYHGRGQAEGLAFSVAPGVPLPPSLSNIFKEMQRDLGTPMPAWPEPGGSLVKWARNGVLLLNTGLTVEEGQPASHAGKGWEDLTDAVIRHVAQGQRPVVFMLWGAHAQSKRSWIAPDRGHLLLMSNHPSPLSALRPPVPFMGNGHFGRAREFRLRHGSQD